MATTPKLVGPTDPALLKSFENQAPSVVRTSPPTVSATGSATSTGGTASRSIAPSTSGDTTTYTQATQASSGTELFIVSSNNNDSNDIVTVYNTEKQISVSAVNQTINNYRVTNSNSYGNSNVAAFLPTYDGNLSSGNLSVSGVSDLGSVANVRIEGGTNGQVLSTNGSGILSWVVQTGGGSNTGNWEFRNNTMYNMAGGEINNGDPTHGATAGLVLPNNGNAGAGTSLFNTYGNIGIAVANLANSSNTKVWTFDTTGDINIPPNASSFQSGRIQSANGYPTLLAYGTGEHGGPELTWANTNNVNDLSNANVIRNTMYINDTGLWVGMNENNVANTFTGGWNFTPDGTTIFPTLEVDLHNGGVQTGQVLQFGNSSQQAIITGPTPDANVSAQRLIIQGQSGNGQNSEGGDVYVWAGDAQINGGDIKIYAGDADNASAGSGGYINLAGGDGFDNGGDITLNGGYSANGYGGQISITGGQGQIDGGPASITGGYATAGNGGAVNITGGTSSVGPSAYGNVEIGSGIYGWSFNNEGNLVLPGNTFAVNYANGTQVPLGGGGANTGNVTFDDINIIGTGNLHLQPDPANAASYLDVFLSSGPDLHLVASNGANLILGEDNGPNVMASWDGNVYVQSWNTGTNTQGGVWKFGEDGNLTLPANTFAVNYANGTQVPLGGSNVTLPLSNGNSNFDIAVANGNATITANGTSTWTFDNTGNLNTAGDIVGPANANFTIYSNAAAHEFIFADDGTFYAPDNVVLGGNSIYIGPGANTLAGIEHEVLLASSNNFAYVQGVINNVSDNGSAEWVALGAKGDDSGGWGEIGFTSSGFGDANYTITGAGDGYVFAQAYAPGSLAPAVGGGNLVLATGNQGTTKDIIFGTGGFLTGNIFGRISHANNSLELSRTGATITFPDSTEQNTAWTGSVTRIANGNSNVSVPTSSDNVYINVNGGSSKQWIFDTAGNLRTPGNVDIYGAINFPQQVSSLNWSTYNIELSQYGRITTNVDFFANANTIGAQYLKGDGSNISNIAGANISGFVPNANVANTAFAVAAANVSGLGNIATVNLDGNVSNLLTGNGTYVAIPTVPTVGNIATINLDGNSQTWLAGNGVFANIAIPSVGNIATINLDGSSSNVLYGNGVFAAVSGGNANTGNVTFDDVTVQGVNGLNLSAGADFTANLAYLQVRAGDTPSHIHMDTGNNQAYDLIIGDDQKFVQVSSTGNIILSSYDSNTNQYTWTFGNDGTTTFPTGNITSNTSLQFTTTFANVKTVEYQTAGVWDLYVEDGITGSNTAASRLNVSFKDNLIDKPQVYIENTKESDGIALRWTFDENGNLNFPRDVAGNTDPYLSIVGGATPTIVSTNASLTGPANLAIQADYLNLSDLVIAGNANVFGTNSSLLQTTDNRPLLALSSGANGAVSSLWVEDVANVGTSNIAAVYANPTVGSGIVRIAVGQNGGNAGPNLWDFGTDGNLTIPGTSGGFIKTVSNASIGIAAMDNGTNNPSQLLSINAGSGAATSIVSAYATNATIQTNAAGNINTWQFDNAGNLTLPTGGQIIVSGGLVSSGASPAPTINGFSITNSVGISGNGNIAGGNISTTGQITSTKAGNLSDGGGQLYLNGSGNNRIDFNTNGTGAPSFTTRSAGAKVVLYPSIGASATDYAMGVDAGTLWSGVPAADAGQFFKWYGGTTEVANLSGTGMLTVIGNVTGGNIITGGVVSATGNVSGNFFLGNGSQLTGITATSLVNGTSNVVTTNNGNVTIGIAGNAAIATFTGTGANVTGTLNVTGNVTAQGVGTNLVRRANTISGSNTAVTLDNLNAYVGGTPIRLYIGAATSNMTMAGQSQTMSTGALAVSSWINVPIVTGTGNGFAMSGAITNDGDTAVLNVTDQGAGSGTWRVTGMIANTSANLYSVSIERLA